MRCPKCQFENPTDSRFCGRCGTQTFSAEDSSRRKTETIRIESGELSVGSTFAQRYQVIRELGRGGMGRVYKVFDLEIKENVALKLLSPILAADSATIERFRDELKLARRISHRNVCRVYDLNREGEIYYITMEYVSGSDLRSIIKRTGDWTLEKSVSIAKQICRGLAEAHGLGVVHRDLKPHNIVLDKKGMVRILDFGLARALAVKGKTERGIILGTPHYLSPEQIEGQAADCRSDVYSLGILLFELMTGKVPFDGDTTLSIAYQHKNSLPPHPSMINPLVPEDIAGIILRCLEKDPARRYPEAGEVLSALESCERGASTTSSIPLPRPAELFAIGEEPAETETRVFVAREAELEKLDQFAQEMLKGRGKVVLVTGEAGSGKTALLTEFMHRVQKAHDDLIISYGKCSAQTGIGDPYLPFREVLNLLTGEVEARWAARAIGREHAFRLWNFLPFSVQTLIEYGPGLIDTFVSREILTARCAACTARSPEWSHRLGRSTASGSPESLSSNLQQQDLFEQYTRVLKVLARERPLALIIDDLQWVDAGSTGLLFHLGRRLEGSRILVIGAYRPAEVASGRNHERHPLEPVVNELKRDFGDFEVELGRADDRRFVPAFLDTEPNELGAQFRETLFRLTRGHPLFTIELLRAMQEKNALVQNEKGKWVEGPELDWDSLPARVEAVIGERINRLPAQYQEILTWAAVEGEEFTAEAVARLLQIDNLEMVKILSQDLDRRHRLISAQGVRQLDSQRVSLYRFGHILFQRYLYAKLDPVERAHRHEKVGLTLESLYQRDIREVSVQLIRHFQISGLTMKTVDYLEMAGEQAMRSYASKEAVDYLTGALEWDSRLETRSDAGRRARWERQLGEAFLALGQMAESRVRMDRAIAMADKPLPAKGLRMFTAIANQALVQGAHLLWPRRFVGRSKKSRDSLLESAYIYERMSETFYYTLEKIPAIYSSFRAVNLCEGAGLSPGLARNYANLSLATGLISFHKLSQTYGRRAMEIARVVDPLSTQGYVSLVLSLYYIGIGCWEKVEALLTQAIEIFHKIGDWRRWELCQSTLGTRDFLQGRYVDCAMKNETMYRIADQRGDIQLGYTALVTQALNQLRQGNLDRAMGYLASVDFDRLTEENRFEKISALAVLALAQLYKGEKKEASASAESALRLFMQPDPRYSIFRGYPCVAEVFLTLWEESGKDETPDGQMYSRLSRLACRALHRFSQTFPIGKPGDLVWQGLYEWLRGRPGRARNSWKKGVEAAEERGLPFEQAQACYEMGRHSAGRERQEYLSRACDIFGKLGSTYHLARAEEARKESGRSPAEK
jgi:tetratricopeptide (TPR) repeat protein